MNLFDDVYFMKQALLEACEAASEGEVPVGPDHCACPQSDGTTE